MRILNNRYVVDPKTPPRKGGMAEVLRAVDMEGEQRDVAIKLFAGGFAQDRYSLEAYNREVRALQLLDHPNIVRILDGWTDTESGTKYLVLEWLDSNLSDHLEHNPIAGWDDFYAQVGRPLLEALNYAFSRDIVHRDLKPQNILVAKDGTIKVVDFGIAKFKRSIQPGLTLSDFRTEPYAPPERDDGQFSDTRDVHGFAVLCLECLGQRRLTSYDEVYSALENCDVPEEVFKILSDSLSRRREARPGNVAVLFDQLQAIQTAREKGWLETCRCYIQVSANAVRRLSQDFPGYDDGMIRRSVLEDVNESCALRQAERDLATTPSKPDDVIRVDLISAQYIYETVVDKESKDHLVVVSVSGGRQSHLEFLRESSWTPALEFRLGRPLVSDDGRRTMEWLIEGLISNAERVRKARLDEKRDLYFRTLEKILIAKQAIDHAQERPLAYSGVSVEGRRVRLSVPSPPDEDLIGQPRYIRLPDGRTVSGEVDEVSDGTVVLWTDCVLEGVIPRAGRLIFDTRADRVALQRQRIALDSIRFQRCTRPALKDYLIDPATSARPMTVPDVSLFQKDLDDDKHRAIGLLLGTQDFLVIEGPPGTGKTRLITEAILQVLNTNPDARILLTSQTHVALDNALERVLEISPATKSVRIGRREDPRIASSVTHHLLENKTDAWLAEVRERSDAFISDWATRYGLDRAEIDLGVAVSALRLALEEEQAREAAVMASQSDVDRITAEIAAKEAAADGTTFHELKEHLRQAQEDLAQIKRELRRTKDRRKQAAQVLRQAHELGRDISGLTLESLRLWEVDLLNRDDASRQCRRLIALLEEWHVRFGRSTDFHGALIADSQVVAGTCLGFAGAKGMGNIEFDLCIVDEASKATTTEVLVPLSRARRWVLIGDRRQLPPFVDMTLDDPQLLEKHDLSRHELGRTLLDHLSEALPSDCCTKLTRQHRMIPPIGDLISHCFYDGELISANVDHVFDLSLAFPMPVTWRSTARRSSHQEVRAKLSLINLAEVEEIKALIRRIEFVARTKKKRYSVAVLAGYSAQRAEISRALASIQGDLTLVTVICNTVDAFQGRDADIAIYSVTRCNAEGKIGFLHEQRRLNVALSRGRVGLVIVGDHLFCRAVSGKNPFQCVLEHIEQHPDGCCIEEAS